MQRHLISLAFSTLATSLACTAASDTATTAPHPAAGPTATQTPGASPPPAADVPAMTASPDSTPEPLAPALASAPEQIPECDASLDVLTVTAAYAKRKRLHGKRVSVQGTLRAASRGCTEKSCGNSCRFAVELTAGGAVPTRGAFFSLREGTEPYNHRFECIASAGDPCKGTEPRDATEPTCAAVLPTTPLVATGMLSTEDDLGASCSPACTNPRILADVSLCRPV